MLDESKGSVTVLQKVYNVEAVEGADGSKTYINKNTGQPFTDEEWGKVQYQYYKDEEAQERLSIRRNIRTGNFEEGENEFIPVNEGDNWFNDIYTGSNNPTADKTGVDYRREPLDIVDAASKEHDLDYDKLGKEGATGVLSRTTISADHKLANKGLKAVVGFILRKNDPYTGKKISFGTALTGAGVFIAFKTIAIVKKFVSVEITIEKGKKE